MINIFKMCRFYSIISLLLILSGSLFGQDFKEPQSQDIALFPVQNNYRNMLHLSGIWNFKVDSLNEGEKLGWNNGFENSIPMAVPASWNEQYDFLRDYLDKGWYSTNFYVNMNWQNEQIWIRFGSISYKAKIWINGKPVGINEGGHLPFSFCINKYLNFNAENTLIVQVENEMQPTRIPVGGRNNFSMFSNNLNTSFDYFPFAGIHRDVLLYTVPNATIKNIVINTSLQDSALAKIIISKLGKATSAKIQISGNGQSFDNMIYFNNFVETSFIYIPKPRKWNLNDPYLYQCKVSLFDKNKQVDEYKLSFGIRTIRADSMHIYLNDEPIILKGFGKHEDFPIFGKGVVPPVIVKDFSLLKWIGANSFRTAHYPYDESYYDLADKLGFLIIDESPAVGLFFEDGAAAIETRKKKCLQQIETMIERDKNHPSIIMWSLANEPITNSKFNQPQTIKNIDSSAFWFFKDLFDYAKKFDPTRLATIVNLSNFLPETPHPDYSFADVIAVNLYYGWYSQYGNLKLAAAELNKEVIHLYQKTKKPIFVSEFGADTYPGMHQSNPEMFTEEYQRDLIKMNLDILSTIPFVAGYHIWTFADFKTAQGIIRFGAMNYKGVFTRDRKPKMVADYIKSVWNK